MDISSIPARVELAVSHSPIETRLKVAATTGRPETTNPVTAPDRTTAATQVQSRPFQPLDVFQVGDNDDVPAPPEPPRRALALVAVELPEQPDGEAANAATETPDHAPTGPATDQAPRDAATVVGKTEPYAKAQTERANPTVDIRR